MYKKKEKSEEVYKKEKGGWSIADYINHDTLIEPILSVSRNMN